MIKNSNEKQDLDTRLKNAYLEGSKAIVKALGGNTEREIILEVIMLLSHSLLTGKGQLDLEAANHNADVFSARLKNYISETQKNVVKSIPSSRLM